MRTLLAGTIAAWALTAAPAFGQTEAIAPDLAAATAATAQIPQPALVEPQVQPSKTPFTITASVFMAMHVADMATTSYSLTQAAPGLHVREANPFLAPLQSNPAALAVASGAIAVTEVWALSRLYRHHRRLALFAMAGLAAAKGYAFANNLHTISQIRSAQP